ncbi:MAG: phosphoribosylamine--glycine ligase [Proteobacteria bacterium]|nr:phosphoribosylamine--glycine ligase [Pseudomonadota bacterium]MBU4468855.1 phosphoribosylamine--glycine ligase [Pseudomonadota bacterium]MCG2750848.1 phosphoribosylamine--glycine ligase [Desulfobacteraceae bacterium]
MKILVVGGGGREHALVWKIAQSPGVSKIFCAPGNAGIAEWAECVPIPADDVEALVTFAEENVIDLTVIGPEVALSLGITDKLEAKGLKVFGPSKKAAEIEFSKSFAKDLMTKYNIPTAMGKSFTALKPAQAFIKKVGAPLVVKADGLAAGKGVIICASEKEAMEALKSILVDKAYGDAGKTVVVEEFLTGEEASFLAFTDGKTVLPLPTSQDHKAIYDDDKGPNTGGMGAYSPAPVVSRLMQKKVMDEIMIPTVKAMAAEKRPYKGVLYAGLMIQNDQIKVLEFNGRFGDPEAQPLLMRMKNDMVPVMEAVVEGRLDQCKLEIDPRASVCIVMAAGGYPGAYKKGLEISGLSDVKRMKDVVVFHAGTATKGKSIVTTGGRVLGVTALGDSVEEAVKRAYAAAGKIKWSGVYFRKDIGGKAIRRMNQPPEVGIVMGSDSDLPVMDQAAAILTQFGIPYEMTVASAHRSPARAAKFASTAKSRGMKVIIAGAGHAAHLAGVLAAHTTLPVIGVPIDSSCLNGIDALYSTVQMPPGIPVATVSIGKPGGRNAGILAAQIIALSNPDVQAKLEKFKIDMAQEVEAKAKKMAEI